MVNWSWSRWSQIIVVFTEFVMFMVHFIPCHVRSCSGSQWLSNPLCIWGLETTDSCYRLALTARPVINPKWTALQQKRVEWRCNASPVSVGEANNFRSWTGDVGRLLRQTGILSKCWKCATRDILNGCWRPSWLWNLIIFRHFADVAQVVKRGIEVSI